MHCCLFNNSDGSLLKAFATTCDLVIEDHVLFVERSGGLWPIIFIACLAKYLFSPLIEYGDENIWVTGIGVGQYP